MMLLKRMVLLPMAFRGLAGSKGQMLGGFSTESKNVFTLPKKHEIHPQVLAEVSSSIYECYTVKMLAYLFRSANGPQDNIRHFVDLQVADMFAHIAENKLQVDDTMHSIIVPITVEYINAFTIQNGESLAAIAINAAIMELDNDLFWNTALKKLDAENIYRYIPLPTVAKLLNVLAKHGKYINHPLVTKLSAVVNKHALYYQNFLELSQMNRETSRILEEKGEKPLQIENAPSQLA